MTLEIGNSGFETEEEKHIELYKDTYNECCKISNKITKESLISIWDQVFKLEDEIQKELQGQPSNEELDSQIEEERRKMHEAENKCTLEKERYSQALFSYRKIADVETKFFGHELTEENDNKILKALFEDEAEKINQIQEGLLKKKRQILALML